MVDLKHRTSENNVFLNFDKKIKLIVRDFEFERSFVVSILHRYVMFKIIYIK